MIPRLLRILALALFLAALAVGCATFVPFEWWRARMDGMAFDGVAGAFTPVRFQSIAWKVRIGSVLILAGAVLLDRRRGSIASSFSGLGRGCHREFSAVLRETRSALLAEDRLHLVVLALLLVWGATLRILHLDLPLRQDEAYTFLNYASKPLWFGLTHYDEPNNHILHTLLCHLSFTLFGSGAWALRLPALIAGTAFLPMAYVAIRVSFGREPALLSLAGIAAGPELIKYATNARGYAMILLVFAVLWWSVVRLRSQGPGDRWVRERRLGAWVGFVLAATVGFASVPVMLFPAGTMVLWLLASSRGRGLSPREVAAGLGAVGFLTALFYAPAFAVSGAWPLTRNETLAPLGWNLLPGALLDRAVLVWRLWNQSVPLGVGILVASGFLLGLALPGRRQGPLGLVLAAVVWSGTAVCVLRVDPFARVWLFLLPVYWATAMVGWNWVIQKLVRRPRMRSVVVPLLAVATCASVSAGVLRDSPVAGGRESGYPVDGQEIARFLAESLEPQERILTPGSIGAAVRYYTDRAGIGRERFRLDPGGGESVYVVAPGSMSWDETLGSLDLGAGSGQPLLLSGAKEVRRFDRFYPAVIYLCVTGLGEGID